MSWQDHTVKSARDCLHDLRNLMPSERATAFHGTPRDWGRIVSRLDLRFETHSASDLHGIEMAMLESFARDAAHHLSPQDQSHIDDGSRDWRGALGHTGTMYVGRHYGLETRCVDWTWSGFVALFFACRRMFDQPGVVWWMNYESLTERISAQWPKAYGKANDVEADFEQDFQAGIEKDVLLRLHYPERMERAITQKAWILVAGRYGADHDEFVHRLDVRPRGRIVVPAALKREVLRLLDDEGVNGPSLGLGGSCAELIASDVVTAMFAQRAP